MAYNWPALLVLTRRVQEAGPLRRGVSETGCPEAPGLAGSTSCAPLQDEVMGTGVRELPRTDCLTAPGDHGSVLRGLSEDGSAPTGWSWLGQGGAQVWPR